MFVVKLPRQKLWHVRLTETSARPVSQLTSSRTFARVIKSNVRRVLYLCFVAHLHCRRLVLTCEPQE